LNLYLVKIERHFAEMSFLGGFIQKIFNPSLIITRTRYHATKMEKGPLIRRYGYKDDIIQKGRLPRLDCGRRLPMPVYK
jgi:large subunit ribosomal protein L51